jgi:hypothetical protein
MLSHQEDPPVNHPTAVSNRLPVSRLLPLGIAALALALAATPAPAKVTPVETGGFTVEVETLVPLSPEAAFDAMTGDISGWWDHSMSEKPQALYIEPKPGGGFYEIFDESGDGALHATVIYAKRGERLRFTGPLGLSGHAINLVVTYDYLAEGDGTRVKVTCNAAGEYHEGWAETVDAVWSHFILERFTPYAEKLGGAGQN